MASAPEAIVSKQYAAMDSTNTINKRSDRVVKCLFDEVYSEQEKFIAWPKLQAGARMLG